VLRVHWANAEEAKNLFYTDLQEQIDKTPRHDIVIVMGDMNTKVGSENTGYETCMGKEEIGVKNVNGQRLADLCSEHGLVIWRHRIPTQDNTQADLGVTWCQDTARLQEKGKKRVDFSRDVATDWREKGSRAKNADRKSGR